MTGDGSNSLYDSPSLYDAEFGGYRADLPFYARACERFRGRVVELGCGTGRLWLQLALDDYLGVDASDDMLARLRLRAAKTGRLAPPLVRADLRSLPIASGCARAAILAYNVLQHMMDHASLCAALVEAARIVGRDGVVALDTFMPPLPGMSRDDADFGWVEQRRHPDGTLLHVAEQTVHDPGTGVQRTRLRFSHDEKARDGEVLNVTRRLWPAEALHEAIVGAGLLVAVLWGDVDGEEWTPRSARFMALCQPRG